MGGGGGGTCPLARPGRGSLAAGLDRPLGGRGGGGPGPGMRSLPPRRQRGGMGVLGAAGPGEGAERGANRARLFPARLCEPKPREGRHRLQTEDGSPRPSSGALCITARPPILSLPGCTWPPAQGSSSPARSRHAGPAGESCFGPGCSIPPLWGWGKAKCHSLLENKGGGGARELEAESGIRRRRWLCFGMETAPSPHGRQAVGQS